METVNLTVGGFFYAKNINHELERQVCYKKQVERKLRLVRRAKLSCYLGLTFDDLTSK